MKHRDFIKITFLADDGPLVWKPMGLFHISDFHKEVPVVQLPPEILAELRVKNWNGFYWDETGFGLTLFEPCSTITVLRLLLTRPRLLLKVVLTRL